MRVIESVGQVEQVGGPVWESGLSTHLLTKNAVYKKVCVCGHDVGGSPPYTSLN